jgi:hypothetical protein
LPTAAADDIPAAMLFVMPVVKSNIQIVFNCSAVVMLFASEKVKSQLQTTSASMHLVPITLELFNSQIHRKMVKSGEVDFRMANFLLLQ